MAVEASTNNPEPEVPELREPMSQQRVEGVQEEVEDPSGKAKLADPDGVEIDPYLLLLPNNLPLPEFFFFYPSHTFCYFRDGKKKRKLYVNKIIRKMISLKSIFFYRKNVKIDFHFFRVCKKMFERNQFQREKFKQKNINT